MTEKNKILEIAVIGAGVRGVSLARKILTSGMPARIVAVAEPDPEKSKNFSAEFNLKKGAAFKCCEDFVSGPVRCDAVIIATLDNQHAGPAIACLNHGLHILIEKPLADTLDDCVRIVNKQKEKKSIIAVCHTLRFMNGYRKVKDLIVSGAIGEIVHIDHMEAISNLRYAHNYVRGRWSQEKLNTFLLLHKCSHDIDYLCWLIDRECIRVSSFGSLKYFNVSNAPDGSTYRCTDGCRLADSCPYSAVSIYVRGSPEEWPARDISVIHTPDAYLEAVKKGPYGICVWHGENDVVDHQVVMMEFEGGATATCTLTGYSSTNGRRIRLQGTRGELLFDESSDTISQREFYGSRNETIILPADKTYHPEDQDIVNEWLSSVMSATPVTVDAAEALRTHAVVFGAELSRREKRTVEMNEILKNSEL